MLPELRELWRPVPSLDRAMEDGGEGLPASGLRRDCNMVEVVRASVFVVLALVCCDVGGVGVPEGP